MMSAGTVSSVVMIVVSVGSVSSIVMIVVSAGRVFRAVRVVSVMIVGSGRTVILGIELESDGRGAGAGHSCEEGGDGEQCDSHGE